MSEEVRAVASVSADFLGDASFRREYGLKYAYYAGAMYKGIASVDLVVAMGRAGLLGFLGTGGLKIEDVEVAIGQIKRALNGGEAYGVNLLSSLDDPSYESAIVDLYLREQVRVVEASAFMQVTKSLVKYRLTGISRQDDGRIVVPNRIIAKVSHPKVAEAFMRPAPSSVVEKLLSNNEITPAEAELSGLVPVASDICVESDSGGHTDQGVAHVLMPAMSVLRDEISGEYQYAQKIRVGAAGGLGSPGAIASAFMQGADFVVTGSVNQCTVEAGISDAVKDLLQDMRVEDTAYAPAGDMFELGAKVQVLKKGTFFPARANKLYELYQRYNGLDEIDERTRKTIQDKYFHRSFDDVWQETRAFYAKKAPSKIAAIEKNPKQKMALIFKWYFIHSTRLSMQGDSSKVVDYQIHCGPALGTFNQWVKGTELESWRVRKVAEIAESLMSAAALVVSDRVNYFSKFIEKAH